MVNGVRARRTRTTRSTRSSSSCRSGARRTQSDEFAALILREGQGALRVPSRRRSARPRWSCCKRARRALGAVRGRLHLQSRRGRAAGLARGPARASPRRWRGRSGSISRGRPGESAGRGDPSHRSGARQNPRAKGRRDMAETEQTAGETFTLPHPPRRAAARWPGSARTGASKRWFRWASIALGAALALSGCSSGLLLARDLPDAETLLDYEPPLPTMVRGVDGEIVHSYARERRVQLQYKDFPAQLVNAYTSAEDETFWTHGGVDYHRHAQRGVRLCHQARLGRARGRRLDDHPAGRQEHPARQRVLGHPQAQGNDPRAAHRGRADQARDHGALSQRDPARPPQLRRAGGEPRLFRQGRRRSRAARDGVPGDPAQGARALRPRARTPPRRSTRRNFVLDHDGRERPHHRGRRRPRPRRSRSA